MSDGDGTHRRRRRRPARLALVAVVVLAIGAAGVMAKGWGFAPGAGGDDRSGHGATLPQATAKVTRQTLVDTQTVRGELGYGDATTVTGRIPGTVTAMPVSESTVTRGHALYHVDNAPVLLLYGSLPAYRALATGTKGPDVTQFEKNLYALGYRGFTVDDSYTDATATAVREWEEDLGMSETGTVPLGRVVYAAAPVRVDARKVAVGDPVQPGAAVLTYTGTARVITVALDVTDGQLATNAAAVSVTLPNGKPVAGKITGAKTVIEPGDGQTEATTKIHVTVAVTDAKALDGIGQATVDVGFVASRRENVLTVPVAALLALAEGGYGLQAVDDATTHIVPVQTGMFASGRVEVTGDGVTEGMTVGMPG